VLIDGRRQLSPQSYSNYVGVGLADVADAQLVTS
jgi:hypothetical protein